MTVQHSLGISESLEQYWKGQLVHVAATVRVAEQQEHDGRTLRRIGALVGSWRDTTTTGAEGNTSPLLK